MDLVRIRKIAEQERLNASGTIGTAASRALEDTCAEIEKLRAAIEEAHGLVLTSPVRAERILRAALEQKADTNG